MIPDDSGTELKSGKLSTGMGGRFSPESALEIWKRKLCHVTQLSRLQIIGRRNMASANRPGKKIKSLEGNKTITDV